MTGEELMYLALAASKRKEYEYVQKAADGNLWGQGRGARCQRARADPGFAAQGKGEETP